MNSLRPGFINYDRGLNRTLSSTKFKFEDHRATKAEKNDCFKATRQFADSLIGEEV